MNHTIIRNGETIALTPDEVKQIRDREHREDIRYKVEDELEACEENGWISFDTWSSMPFGNYSSADDARHDFVEKCIEDVLDEEDLFDHSPEGYTPDIEDIVWSNAEFFEIVTKEGNNEI